MPGEKYRLVTRSDFDGLVCAALLRELDVIDDIKFVHPKDMQDGKIEITDRDITTNLPYVPEAHMVFDHHSSETQRVVGRRDNRVIDPDAPSAARVVFNYYGGFNVFPERWNEMMLAVDQGDSAQYSADEILNPSGWALLNFLMDARTGLGRFRQFRISNYALMMDLIDNCRVRTIEEILELPDVKERVDLYQGFDAQFKEQLIRCGTMHGDVVVLDLRDEEIIYPGNRFMIYALFPKAKISVHAIWGVKKQNTVFAVGKSILDRSSQVNIGALMLEYNGGGHQNAGTCQVANDEADEVLEQLLPSLGGKKQPALV